MSTLMSEIRENRLLGKWGALLERHPGQLNQIHEADAELIPLPNGDGILAVTTDTIAEEIALGFYQSPETIGWAAATACLSDLAAVGAAPIGVVVSVTLPMRTESTYQAGIARGLSGACRAAGTFVLGGDTNHGEQPSVTGCAIGILPRAGALGRTGCCPGDIVYVTGLLGAGAAAAARSVFDLPPDIVDECDFRPTPRTAEMVQLTPCVNAAMDTSDGLIATLDQLSRLNDVGMTIDTAVVDLLDPGARRVCEVVGVPPIAMVAAHTGEYEVVLTVDEALQESFEAAAQAVGLDPRRAGQVTEAQELTVDGRPIDGAAIRNLADEATADLSGYLQELLRLVS